MFIQHGFCVTVAARAQCAGHSCMAASRLAVGAVLLVQSRCCLHQALHAGHCCCSTTDFRSCMDLGCRPDELHLLIHLTADIVHAVCKLHPSHHQVLM